MSERAGGRGIVTVDETICQDLYRIAGRRFVQFIEDFSRPSIASSALAEGTSNGEAGEGWDAGRGDDSTPE